MFELKVIDWLWAVAFTWACYIQTKVSSIPNRDELDLRQLVNDERHKEIKEDLLRLERKLDRLCELFYIPDNYPNDRS